MAGAENKTNKLQNIEIEHEEGMFSSHLSKVNYYTISAVNFVQ